MKTDQIVELVQTKIYSIRGQKVMLDADIAEVYGVETKRINEAVRNNPGKFPEDFFFELEESEQEALRSKISTLKNGQIVEKLSELEGKVSDHDEALKKILQALSELMQQAHTEETRKIGFLD